MKRNDLIKIVLAVGLAAGGIYIVYGQFVKPKKAEPVKIEVVTPIEDKFDEPAKAAITDTSKNRDFSVPVDFSGLNNPRPFGP
jgi:hypothetical protein